MNDREILKLKTILRECIEEVINEREKMRLDERARVGIMLNNLDTFNNKQCREFNGFMKQPCRFPKYRNNCQSLHP